MMMTLNRLNVQESEADVEGLASSEVKLEFEPGPEEVAGWDEVPFYFSVVSPRRGWCTICTIYFSFWFSRER